MAQDLSRAVWRKAAGSTAGQDCVELTRLARVVGVRDSKNPDGPALTFSPAEWRTFADALKGGQLER